MVKMGTTSRTKLSLGSTAPAAGQSSNASRRPLIFIGRRLLGSVADGGEERAGFGQSDHVLPDLPVVVGARIMLYGAAVHHAARAKSNLRKRRRRRAVHGQHDLDSGAVHLMLFAAR